MSNELAIKTDTQLSLAVQQFELNQRDAKALSLSSLLPDQFKGNLPDCIRIIEMAHRLGASPLAVAQSIYFVHGKPSWSATFIIACINSCGRFAGLRFEMVGEGDSKSCFAWATDKATGDRVCGPPVSIAMAKKEGWYSKSGSKWPSMSDLMLQYRAATFFGRLYTPEILMGMHTRDELEDMKPAQAKVVKPEFGETDDQS